MPLASFPISTLSRIANLPPHPPPQNAASHSAPHPTPIDRNKEGFEEANVPGPLTLRMMLRL